MNDKTDSLNLIKQKAEYIKNEFIHNETIKLLRTKKEKEKKQLKTDFLLFSNVIMYALWFIVIAFNIFVFSNVYLDTFSNLSLSVLVGNFILMIIFLMDYFNNYRSIKEQGEQE